MLKGISPVISPDLLATLAQMGHGDEIVLADAHFPGASVNDCVLRADGISVKALLNGILPLFEIDSYAEDALVMMSPVSGDELDPSVESAYREVIDNLSAGSPHICRIERFAFYERASDAFCVVMTGETAKYGNIILKKGVTPC